MARCDCCGSKECCGADLGPRIESQAAEITRLREQNEAARKDEAVAFFRWWYNQPGSNTDHGYDSWIAAGKPGLEDEDEHL